HGTAPGRKLLLQDRHQPAEIRLQVAHGHVALMQEAAGPADIFGEEGGAAAVECDGEVPQVEAGILQAALFAVPAEALEKRWIPGELALDEACCQVVGLLLDQAGHGGWGIGHEATWSKSVMRVLPGT